MRFMLIVLLMMCGPASAADFNLKSGTISYDASYVTKTVHGVSHDVKGRIRCAKTEGDCDFLMAVPVTSFDSGNSSRDSNMRQTVKAAEFPVETMSGTAKRSGKTVTELQNVKVKLAGVEQNYGNLLLKRTAPGCYSGSFELTLSEHKVERPSLMGISIKDKVPVNFEGCFTE